MKLNKKIATGVAASLLALSLTGCVQFVGPGEEGAPQTEAPAPQPVPGEAEPQTEGERSWADKVAAAKGKVPGGNEGIDGQSDVKEAKTIDLTPESGIQYVRAMSGFSPNFEQWVFDREKSEMSYKRINCLGQSEDRGTGQLAWTDATGDQSASVEITWDVEPPHEVVIPRSRTAEYDINDRSLLLGVADSASSRTDAEVEKFKNMCAETSQAIAGLVL